MLPFVKNLFSAACQWGMKKADEAARMEVRNVAILVPNMM